MNKRYRTSLKLWEKSKKFLVPSSSTISKHPKLYTQGAYPIYLERGKGAQIQDVDGNTYLDFQSALGAIILGTQHPVVMKAVHSQMQKGVLFSLASPLQMKLAEKICAMVPCAERARILKNGSDATSAAIRIARAFTGRTKIASCHFHGWHDWFYVTTSMNKGIPKKLKRDILEFKYNDIASLRKIFKKNKEKIAAVILEPANLEKQKSNFLKEVKKVAHQHGALLIFDEVVTGFRFSRGGAQEYFGITPDLCCLGKALANGFPLSAVAGKAHIMDKTEEVITSMTYGEETLSVAAAIATLNVLEKEPVVRHIWTLGKCFQEEYNRLAKTYKIPTTCIGYPCRLQLTFSDYKENEKRQVKGFFLQKSAEEGILFGNMIFMTSAHTQQDADHALRVCEKIFRKMSQQQGKLPLKGKLPVELW